MQLVNQSIIKSVIHSFIYSFSHLDIYFSSHSVSQSINELCVHSHKQFCFLATRTISWFIVMVDTSEAPSVKSG